MRILLDTHLLLWAVKGTLSTYSQKIIEDTSNDLYFSPINMWEIELKNSRLNIDTKELYKNLLANGYKELQLSSRHVINVSSLPNIHKDPFDRILLAQASVERMKLFTADEALSHYAETLDCLLIDK